MDSFELDALPVDRPNAAGSPDTASRPLANRVIAASKGASAQRWELPSMVVNEDHSPAGEDSREFVTEATTPTPLPPTAEELAAIRDMARRQGHAEGLAEGRAEAREELLREIDQIGAVMKALSDPLAELDQCVVDEVAGLACDIARQLVRRELSVEPGQIVAVVRETVALLPVTERQVTLRLHPEDAELVERILASDQEAIPWKIEEDPLLGRGGCRVLSGNSSIDATVESRLGAVIARVLGDGRRRSDRDG